MSISLAKKWYWLIPIVTCLDLFSIDLRGQSVDGMRPAGETGREQQIDELFKPWNRLESPGAEVAIIDHGRIVFEKGYGSSDLEDAVAITPNTVFHVASVSKQFTAMAIVLLEQDGKLSLDDDIHRYLPELPDYGEKIMLRNLLQHTSGIRDQWQLLGMAGWDLRDVITQDQILRVLFRQKQLNFKPGTKWLYSNGAFTLLAEVVKRVSGEGLPEFCKKRIFDPLGMTQTHFHLFVDEVVPHRALSYGGQENHYEYIPLSYSNVGATSLYSTSSDLVKWLDNFRDGKVGGPKALARMQEEGVLENGRKTGYALGLALKKYRGVATIGHDGGDAGYRSNITWFPEQQVGIAVLSNLASFDASQMANKVADIMLADSLIEKVAKKAVEAPHKEVKIDPAVLDRYVGTYEMEGRPGFTQSFKREGDRFYLLPINQPRYELFAESETQFSPKEFAASFTFPASTAEKVDGFVQHQNGHDYQGKRYEPKPLDPAAAAELEGVYWSDELDTQYSFFIENGRLCGFHLRTGKFDLRQIKDDKFACHFWFCSEVAFNRGADGKVESVTLGGGRVAGVKFVKKSATPVKS